MPLHPTYTFPWLAARVCPCTLPGALHIPSHGWQPVYVPMPLHPTHTFPWLAARVCPCTLPGASVVPDVSPAPSLDVAMLDLLLRDSMLSTGGGTGASGGGVRSSSFNTYKFTR